MCAIAGRVHQDMRSLQWDGCVWAEGHGVNRGQLANRHTRRMGLLSAASHVRPAYDNRDPVMKGARSVAGVFKGDKLRAGQAMR